MLSMLVMSFEDTAHENVSSSTSPSALWIQCLDRDGHAESGPQGACWLTDFPQGPVLRDPSLGAREGGPLVKAQKDGR